MYRLQASTDVQIADCRRVQKYSLQAAGDYNHDVFSTYMLSVEYLHSAKQNEEYNAL